MPAPVDKVEHGPFVIWLLPDSANQMFDRCGFGWHGDSVINPGDGEHGVYLLSAIFA